MRDLLEGTVDRHVQAVKDNDLEKRVTVNHSVPQPSHTKTKMSGPPCTENEIHQLLLTAN